MLNRPRPNWDNYFMYLIDPLSRRSLDPNTRLACIIVDDKNSIVSTGYNSLPSGIEHKPERLERPLKYKWIEHTERNAIYAVARRGGPSLAGCRIYMKGLSCVDCTRAIISVGIKEIIIDKNWQHSWEQTATIYNEDFNITKEMLMEAGVKITEWVSSENS